MKEKPQAKNQTMSTTTFLDRFWSNLQGVFIKVKMECHFFFLFGGLECVGHSFAYVAHFWFLIFEGCLDLNPECCRSKLAHYRLSHPSLFTFLKLKNKKSMEAFGNDRCAIRGSDCRGCKKAVVGPECNNRGHESAWRVSPVLKENVKMLIKDAKMLIKA